MLDALQQPLDRAEPRRLDVEPAGVDRQSADVHNRVDRCVEAEPRLLPLQRNSALTVEGGVLQHHIGKELDGSAIQHRIRHDVDSRARVVRLEVEDAHATRRSEALHEGPVPAVLRIELQLKPGVVLQPGEGIAARRDDEPERAVFAPDGCTERKVVLAQRQVERRALEGPAPVIRERPHLRLRLEQAQVVQLRRELPERRAPRRSEVGKPVVILSRVRHVFATALLAFTAEHDSGGDARELSRDVNGLPFRAEVLDVQREAAKLVPERHQPRVGSGLPVGSMRIRW